jgi:hypothetical protein
MRPSGLKSLRVNGSRAPRDASIRPVSRARSGVVPCRMRLRAVGFFWSIAACTSSPGATLGESSGSTSAGAGTSGPTSSSSGGEAATSGSSETTGEPASPGCGAPGAAGKQAGLPLEHDGLARRFDLYVPPGYDPEVAAPLVLNFHGNLSTPAEQAAFSGFEASAGPRGMLSAGSTSRAGTRSCTTTRRWW